MRPLIKIDGCMHPLLKIDGCSCTLCTHHNKGPGCKKTPIKLVHYDIIQNQFRCRFDKSKINSVVELISKFSLLQVFINDCVNSFAELILMCSYIRIPLNFGSGVHMRQVSFSLQYGNR